MRAGGLRDMVGAVQNATPLLSDPPEAHLTLHPPGALTRPRDVSAQGLEIGWSRCYDPALCPAAYSPQPTQ